MFLVLCLAVRLQHSLTNANGFYCTSRNPHNEPEEGTRLMPIAQTRRLRP